MKSNSIQFLRRYSAALRKHLRAEGSLALARAVGKAALAAELGTLEMARIHMDALNSMSSTRSSPADPAAVAKKAAAFFLEAMAPLEEAHCGPQKPGVNFSRLEKTLCERTAALAASNHKLKAEVARRRTIEASLKQSQQHYVRLLEESQQLQEQLRHLSRQILCTQEEERKKISRELHDQIAATLTGVQIELVALKKKTTASREDLKRKISSTQKLVQHSVEIIHRFARDLRPAVLDDLGLIPALRSFAETFSKQTGVRVRLTIFAGVEELDNAKRVVLYRVAQEALTNVAKHAAADHVVLNIVKQGDVACLTIQNNGKAFDVDAVLHNRKASRLGLLGMRERVQMVGGSFSVDSAEGRGTTIRATVPCHDNQSNGTLAHDKS